MELHNKCTTKWFSRLVYNIRDLFKGLTRVSHSLLKKTIAMIYTEMCHTLTCIYDSAIFHCPLSLLSYYCVTVLESRNYSSLLKEVRHFGERDWTIIAPPAYMSWSQYTFLPPARFWKRREVLFWVRSPSPPSPPSLPSPPSPPSPRMFCLISRLLLKLAFWNLACAIYAKTILLKCF